MSLADRSTTAAGDASRPRSITPAGLAARHWLLVLMAYVASILAGVAYAWWVQRGGDWNIGLPWEQRLMHQVRDAPSPAPLEWFLYVVPWISTNLTLFPVAVIASAWMWWGERRRDLALWLMTVELGCFSMNWLIKHLSARERPDLWERVGWFGWGSYPSGHAMVAVSMLGTAAYMLYRERGWTWPLPVTVALVISIVYSRLHHGVHWPTDMIGGVLVGAIWLVSTAWLFGRRRGSGVR